MREMAGAVRAPGVSLPGSTFTSSSSASPSCCSPSASSSACLGVPSFAFCREFYGRSVGVSLALPERTTNGCRRRRLSPSKRHKCQLSSSTVIVPAQAAKQDKSPGNGKPSQTIAITGATGFVGSKLVQRLVSEGHTVRVLTRSAAKARSVFPEKDYPDVEIAEQSGWAKCIQGTTGVVNLAGTPISGRWTERIKRDIKASRLAATSKVVEAINASPKDLRPKVFISGTAVGFYGSTSESSAFDESSPSGKDYLAEVCRDWEGTAQTLDSDIRLVRLRLGVVLDKGGGALAQMVPLFQVYAGGPLGTGKQWFSWVHRDDLVSLIVEALSNPAYEGAVNGTAPNPVRFNELCDRLGKVLGRPSWLPVPDFAVKAILGEGASLVLEGQRVLPKKAQELGFTFKYQYVNDALQAILA